MLKRFLQLFRSKPINKPAVQASPPTRTEALYAYIREYKNCDSEYWTSGNGYFSITSQLKEFSPSDWAGLKSGLPNWSPQELEIFTEGILTGDDNFDHYDEKDLFSFDHRFELIPVLIKISEERGSFNSEIEAYISENFSFILRGNPKPLNLLLELKPWVAKGDWRDAMGTKAENPHVKVLEEAISISRKS